ncbi:MAG: hypothetical protein OIN83_12805 [Candidatus Methanoperedens sp.]|nr:hypothetical protein [Candidatus Methanoperedens sp.]
MDISSFYPILSTINLVAVLICIYYGKKLYDSTKGAADFWLFLSAFIFSLGGFILFDFIRKTMVSFNSPIMAAQDLAITFAAVFALVAAIYIKKMFDNMLGE